MNDEPKREIPRTTKITTALRKEAERRLSDEPKRIKRVKKRIRKTFYFNDYKKLRDWLDEFISNIEGD